MQIFVEYYVDESKLDILTSIPEIKDKKLANTLTELGDTLSNQMHLFKRDFEIIFEFNDDEKILKTSEGEYGIECIYDELDTELFLNNMEAVNLATNFWDYDSEIETENDFSALSELDEEF